MLNMYACFTFSLWSILVVRTSFGIWTGDIFEKPALLGDQTYILLDDTAISNLPRNSRDVMVVQTEPLSQEPLL